MMSLRHLLPIVLLASWLGSGCDQSSKRVHELERQAADAKAREHELEQQLAEQKLAAERESIERERAAIDQARADLERQGDAAADAQVELKRREESLAGREGKLAGLESAVEQQQDGWVQRDQALDERERDLAGREALAPVADSGQSGQAIGDFTVFHESLTPYGSWFETPDYGYVWQPVVVRERDWRPYTRGRWVCSDQGWTWISEEPFGWATYHYGRWTLLRQHGWVWVPGGVWAPSWVTWRYGGNYVGWAPLPPETLVDHHPNWDSSVEVTFGIGAGWFSFVELRHFDRPIHRHCLSYRENPIYIHQTVNITRIHVDRERVICGGPRYRELSDKIGRPMPFYRIDRHSERRPGRNPLDMRPQMRGDRLEVAAPHLETAWNAGLRPSRVRGRLNETIVDRDKAVRPEISERFRKSRDENRQQAEQAVVSAGGQGNFDSWRNRQLDSQRQKLESSRQKMRELNRPGDGKNDRAQIGIPKEDSQKIARDQEQKRQVDGRRENDERAQIQIQREQSQKAEREQKRLQEEAQKAEREQKRQVDGQRENEERARIQIQREQSQKAEREQKRVQEESQKLERDRGLKRQQELQERQQEQSRQEQVRRANDERARIQIQRQEETQKVERAREVARQQELRREQTEAAERAREQRQQEQSRRQQEERAQEQAQRQEEIQRRQQEIQRQREQQQEQQERRREEQQQRQQEIQRQQEQQQQRQQETQRRQEQERSKSNKKDDDWPQRR